MNKTLTLALIAGGGVALYFALRPKQYPGGPANTLQGSVPWRPGVSQPVVTQQQQSQPVNWGAIIGGIGSAAGSIISSLGLGKGGTAAQSSSGGNISYVPGVLPNYNLDDPTLNWGSNVGYGQHGLNTSDPFGIGTLKDPTEGL